MFITTDQSQVSERLSLLMESEAEAESFMETLAQQAGRIKKVRDDKAVQAITSGTASGDLTPRSRTGASPAAPPCPRIGPRDARAPPPRCACFCVAVA